jgi:hypothetical protein
LILEKEIVIANQQQRVERGVWIYLACYTFLLVLAWVPFLVHWRTRAYFPLSSWSERFGDLAHFASVHQKLAWPGLGDVYHLAGTMFPRNYGPLAVLLYLFLLGFCSPYAVVVFLSILASALTFGSYLLWRAARRSPGYRSFMTFAIFGTSLLALPTAETVMRGNIEGLLWIGYAVGVGYMFSRKWGRAASTLAIASCIKPYPIFLFAILFWRRKYKQIALGCFILLITAIGCLSLLGYGSPEQGAKRIGSTSTLFYTDYLIGFRDVREIVGDHSLLQTSKSVARVIKARSFDLPKQDYDTQPSMRIGYVLFIAYLPFAAIFVIWVLYRIRKKPFLNQVFSLSICLTLFPLLAADYTMTILYLPMGLFLLFLLRDVGTGRVFVSDTRMLSILLPCALLMSPLPLLGIWAGDARSIVLVGLLFIVMYTPMPMAIDSESASSSDGESSSQVTENQTSQALRDGLRAGLY